MNGFQGLEEVFKMSKTICIAHGGDVSEPSGGTNRVIAFATALRDAGFDVHLVVPSPKREFPEDLRDIKIHTVPIKARSIRDQIFRALLVSLKAKKIAKNNNAILQIEHSTLAGFATLVGCSNYILDMHDLAHVSPTYLDLPLSKIVQKFIYNMEQKAVSNASKIIVVSDAMKDFIIDEWGVPEGKIEVIPNGVRNEVSKFKGNEEIKGLVVFLGALTHNIDCNKFIKLAKTSESVKICVIGDGALRSKLLKMIDNEKIKNVTVPGYLPDEEAYNVLSRAQVCIFPLRNTFHTEVAMHMKILDYAMLGKAIATDRDATAKIFEKHSAALVSDPANPNEFIANVHKLLEDEKLRRKLGENAKRLVKDFTWEKQGEKLVRMYEDVIWRFK